MNYASLFIVLLLLPTVAGLEGIAEGQKVRGTLSFSETTEGDAKITVQFGDYLETSELGKTHSFAIDTASGDFPDGDYELTVSTRDGTGVLLNEEELIIVVDNTAPTFLGFSVVDIGTSSATVTVITSEESSSSLSFGDVLGSFSTMESSSQGTEHEFALDNLLSGSIYYYNIEVCDDVGNCASTGTSAFTTASAEAGSLEAGLSKAQVEAKKGSLVVTKSGIFMTIRKNHVKALIFRTAAQKRAMPHIIELLQVEPGRVQFRVGEQRAWLQQGKDMPVDVDGDKVNDIVLRLVSVRDLQTATINFKSVYTLVTDAGILLINEESSAEDLWVEEALEEIQEVVELNKSRMNWVLLSQALLVVILSWIAYAGFSRKK